MKWTTVGAEQIIRTVLAPTLGCAGFAFETFIRDQEARWPVLSVSLALALGQPIARLFDGKAAAEVPPAPEPPALPPSPTARTGDP